MNKRIIGFVVGVIVVIGAIFGFNFYRNSQNNASSTKTGSNSASSKSVKVKKNGKATVTGSNGKVLVVYFSRTKAVYGGDLKYGNTARVADFIQEKTKGDIYKIIPKKSYPTDYDETTKVAQKELDENARPEIKNALPKTDKYQTVFVGGPIWWGEYPMVVRTFLDNVDLNGKTVIPFTTAEGSGLGNTAEVLKKTYPKATVKEGFTVEGNKVKENPAAVKREVDSWLNKLNY